ncbi:partial Plipastatin synthase subunit E, partial [Gammaproteobacteria bacterium]
MPSIFLDRLNDHARRDDSRPAIVQPETSIAYAELVARVDACARSLVRQGLRPGETAGITVRDEASHLIATLALLALGIPQVSIGTHDPVPMRRRLAGRVGVTRIVAAVPEDRLEGLDFALIPADEPLAAGPAALPWLGG